MIPSPLRFRNSTLLFRIPNSERFSPNRIDRIKGKYSFVLSQTLDNEKILSSCEESNLKLWILHSYRDTTTEPQWLYMKQGCYKFHIKGILSSDNILPCEQPRFNYRDKLFTLPALQWIKATFCSLSFRNSCTSTQNGSISSNGGALWSSNG